MNFSTIWMKNYSTGIRIFKKKENNGEKVFLGRGNVWAIGGLALGMDLLPDDFHSKERYKQLFSQMMEKIGSLQDDNAYWHASMLDPASSYPSRRKRAVPDSLLTEYGGE